MMLSTTKKLMEWEDRMNRNFGQRDWLARVSGLPIDKAIEKTKQIEEAEMIEFTTWVEIPVHVKMSVQKAERATRHYPGCPATIGIEDLTIETEEGKKAESLEDLVNHILDTEEDRIKMEGWDYL